MHECKAVGRVFLKVTGVIFFYNTFHMPSAIFMSCMQWHCLQNLVLTSYVQNVCAVVSVFTYMSTSIILKINFVMLVVEIVLNICTFSLSFKGIYVIT